MAKDSKKKDEKKTKKISSPKGKTKGKKASSIPQEIVVKKIKKESITKKTTSHNSEKPKKNFKKGTTKKAAVKKIAVKKNVAKKTISQNKKGSNKKLPNKKAVKIVPNKNVLEYYDLPYRYDETVVKLLAQTPTVLFVYWDVSDADRQKFTNHFGDEFFYKTKPVLIVHNETKNYQFEVEIDDFANCWYIRVDDSSSKYKIELGRRSKVEDYYIPNNYIYITSSNEIESPNDHILFDNHSMVYFRNTKNGVVTTKNIATLTFMRNIGKLYNLYDLYKEMYKDDVTNNPSSNPSSGSLLF